MIFWPLSLKGLWLALHLVLFRAVFCFAFSGLTFSFLGGRGGGGGGGGCIFSSPMGSRGRCWVVSFVLRVFAVAFPAA